MEKARFDAELRSELEAIAHRHGCEVLQSAFSAGIFRLVLDRPEGVTLAECEKVSRETSALLDVLEFGDGRYTLEVSSPGLDRQLSRPEDYQRFTGKGARVTWREPASGKKRTDIGVLAGCTAIESKDATITLDVDGIKHDIRISDVLLARLEPEF